MSFSTDVKDELCGIDLSKSQRRIVFYGMLYGLKKNGDELFFQTENISLINYLIKLNTDKKISFSEISERGSRQFYIRVFCNDSFDLNIIDRKIAGEGDKEAGLFLRGLFLSSGIITNPNREYHLELSVCDKVKCGEALKLINEHGMNIRLSSRKKQPFLYSKESEGIADFLTFIGAFTHSMEIMNVKIIKDVRNNINRSVNCESANLDKTIAAAQKQISDIKLIYETKGKNYLSDELLSVAEIRIKNPHISLSEIADTLEPKITRSGVNHRFANIAKIADKLRNNGE